VGLSLAFVMASGVVINFALPPLGISHPITLVPLLATFTAFFLVLCLLAYVRDKNFRPTPLPKGKVKTEKPSSILKPVLLAILLPLLAVLGASLVNSYQNNVLLFIFIFLVVLIIGLVAFNKVIPERVYPFVIFAAAIALIYQTTFISGYLVGSDIHLEYYFAELVVGSGYWDATINNAVTACLSITMLAPVYSLLLNMDAVWLFKIIYPLFFCLVPLALFHIFRLQFGSRRAFFAAFFFIAMPMFFMDMAQLARQQIAELFFVLVILLMVDHKLTLMQRTILAIIFSLAASATYYGMGPILAGYLILGWLVLIFIKSRYGRALWQWLATRRSLLPPDLTSPGAFTKKAMVIIVGVFLVVTLAYYAVSASGQTIGGFHVLTDIPKTTIEQIVTPPPGTEPPGTEPPGTEPPGTEPPGTEPPGTEPPGTEPPAPVLQSTQVRVVSDTLAVRLKWDAPASAICYRLQLSVNMDFTKLIIDETGITDSYYKITSGLDWHTLYYCRVNASNEYGTSDWSEYHYFLTPATVPAVELPGFIQGIINRFPFIDPFVREPLAQTAIGLDFTAASLGGKIWRIFQYLVELCIIVGFFRLIFRPKGIKLKAEYLSFTLISVLVLLGVYLLSTYSYGMGVTRVFHITLLFLSPLFLLGGEAIAYGIAKLARVFRRGFAPLRLSSDSPAILWFPVLAVLIPYFIFNSGAVFELSRSQTTHFINMPYSIALSSHRVDLTTVSNKQDIAAADWVLTAGDKDYPICADHHVGYFGARLGGEILAGTSPLDQTFYFVKEVPSPSYIYLRTQNIQQRELAITTGYATRQSVSFDDLPWFVQTLEKSDKIYDNGSAWLLLHRR
jgi:uncharacterized membrane protein